MPRYYCDYCDTYLTHDSPSVRKQHNAGYKHKANVRTYYQQFEEQQTQSLIDQRIKEHLGHAAAFQQVSAAFNQHMMAQRPRLPIPMMPPGMRPMVLPRPMPAPPGYLPPLNMPPMMAPPGAPPMRPPPNMNSGPSMAPPPMYQSNPPPSSEPYDTFNANSQPPNDSNR